MIKKRNIGVFLFDLWGDSRKVHILQCVYWTFICWKKMLGILLLHVNYFFTTCKLFIWCIFHMFIFVLQCRHVSKKFSEAGILIQLQNVRPAPGLNSDDVKDRVEKTAVNPGKLNRGKSDYIAKMDIHTFIISQSFENVVARNASNWIHAHSP